MNGSEGKEARDTHPELKHALTLAVVDNIV
jgi:hypothetical protein